MGPIVVIVVALVIWPDRYYCYSRFIAEKTNALRDKGAHDTWLISNRDRFFWFYTCCLPANWPGLDNGGLSHTSEHQFVNWQFHNRRCNCQADSELVPAGQHFLPPNKKMPKATGWGGAEDGSLLQGHSVPQPWQTPRKALAPEKRALGLIKTLLLINPMAIVHPFPSLSFSLLTVPD